MREEIEKYINENYDILQEYPWDKFPNDTTFKHKNNKKWFALIMNVSYEKLKINKEGILPAYHMSKEHWITILLDGTVSKEKICELIDISYELTNNK